MVTRYHRAVQAHLLSIGREARNISRVFGDKRPRHIAHPSSTASFLYYPDATYQTKTGRFYLFEVLDSEEDAQSQVVAHVLEAFLTPNTLKAIFIVKSEEVARKVGNITSVIIGNLEDLSDNGINKTVRFYQVVVPARDARSLAKVRAILSDPGSDLRIDLRPR
jgi:hypothetical protein